MFDAYSHCGTSKYEPWEVVCATHAGAGVTGGMLVQHLGHFDNDYLLEVAASSRSAYRVVGLLDYRHSGWEQGLAAYRHDPELVGLRVPVTNEHDWVATARTTADHGLDVLYYFPRDLTGVADDLIRIAADHPGNRFVLSHFGTLGDLSAPGYLYALERVLAADNIVLMVSGLPMYEAYPHTGLRGPIQRILGFANPERVVWGSNYPASSPGAGYRLEVEYLRTDPWDLGRERLDALLERNSRTLWP